MFSVIYTPTEGEAIENFSKLFRKPEGCFLNVEEQDSIHDHLAQWGQAEDFDYIVVTDGEEVYFWINNSPTDLGFSMANAKCLSVDSGHWRSGRRRHSHFRRETGIDDAVRWNSSKQNAAGGVGLRNRCPYSTSLWLDQIPNRPSRTKSF